MLRGVTNIKYFIRHTFTRASRVYEYVLSQNVMARLKNHLDNPVNCRYCGEPLYVGDPVVRTFRASMKVSLYHQECYAKTLH